MATSSGSVSRRWGVAAIVAGGVLLWVAVLVWAIPGALDRVLAALA